MLHPPTGNQNTPFTFKLIDRAWDQTCGCVCDSWGATRQDFKAASPPLERLNLAAFYLLMKAKYLPRREECPLLGVNPLCLRAIWNGGIHKYWLALIRMIYSVSWTPEKQICLPSAAVERTLSEHSTVLAWTVCCTDATKTMFYHWRVTHRAKSELMTLIKC